MENQDKRKVVTGEFIEMRESSIVTRDGDAICTWHTDHYRLPESDPEVA